MLSDPGLLTNVSPFRGVRVLISRLRRLLARARSVMRAMRRTLVCPSLLSSGRSRLTIRLVFNLCI